MFTKVRFFKSKMEYPSGFKMSTLEPHIVVDFKKSSEEQYHLKIVEILKADEISTLFL